MGKYAFGVDVGGTSIKIGFFDTQGEIQEKWEVKTRTENYGVNILEDIAKSIKEKCKELKIDKEEVLGIGIGVPGPVDVDGIVYGAVNLGWGTLDIPGTMFALTGMRTMAGNDANVAALGEMWKGGGIGHKNIVAVTLGTGVGGGIIVNGEMLAGAVGAAGEIGHIHVEDAETEKCNCGNSGCLEQFTSATGIVKLAKRHLLETDAPSILRKSEVSAKSVFDAVKEKDPLAIEVAEEFGLYLGKALAGVAAVVNPEIFVIGGGVSKAGPILLTFIEKNFKKYVFKGCLHTDFALATLGNDAGITGAVRMIMN
jgi:glucokinase